MTQQLLHTQLAGEYRLVVSSDTNTTDSGWFSNLILDNGLEKFAPANTSNPFAVAWVGTGTSAPLASQTELEAPLPNCSQGMTFISSSNAGAPSYATTQTFSYTFTKGSVIGNISEVGVGKTTAGDLFSRALIVDNVGNPTTITITSIDQLTVYYRITVNPPLTDGTGSIVLDSETYNYTTRILRAANYANSQYLLYNGGYYFSTLYSVTAFAAGAAIVPMESDYPTGTPAGDGSFAHASYVENSHYIDWIITFSPTQGNGDGGIQAFKLASGGPYQAHQYQIAFDKPIPKTNTKSLSLTFRFAWGV